MGLSTIFSSPYTSLWASFLICAWGIKKYAWPTIKNMIEEKQNSISTQLDDAEAQLQTAKEDWEHMQHQERDIEEQILAIQMHAKEEISQIKAETEEELERLLTVQKIRCQQAIKNLEQSAKKDIEKQILSGALIAAEAVLKKKMTPQLQATVFEENLKKLAA